MFLVPVATVKQQPKIRMKGWAVIRIVRDNMEVEDRIVGATSEHSVRVSTPIKKFDSASRKAETESGRVYFIYKKYARKDGVVVSLLRDKTKEDVTDEYM